jgi:Lar family restriction alleviation protein
MTNQPLPCPFCGGEPTTFKHIHDENFDPTYYVECQNDCPGQPAIDGDTEAEAVAAWNTRAYDADVRRLVAIARRQAQLFRDDGLDATANALDRVLAPFAELETT